MRLTHVLLVGLCCLALGTVGCGGSSTNSDGGRPDAHTGTDAGDAGDGGSTQSMDGGDGGSMDASMSHACDNYSCPSHSSCQVNEAGAPYCKCDASYMPTEVTSDAGTMFACQMSICASANCDPNATCSASPDNSSYACTCNPGYMGDGMTCAVDHCAPMVDSHGVTHAGVCDPNAICKNDSTLPAGFKCTCDPGYIGDGMTCYIDICANNNGGCDQHATCTNNKGTAQCKCNMGWTGDGMTCTDEDECTDGSAVCPDHAHCVNTPGAYSCECDPSYQMNAGACEYRSACLNVQCPMNSTCTDHMDGTASCTCASGYVLNPANTPATCDDIDECLTNNGGCDPSMTCVNTPGSFYCACGAGSVGNAANGCRSGYANTVPALGDAFGCAVASDHTLWCWGDDSYGQMGDGQYMSSMSVQSPTQVGNDADWSWVTAGPDYACGGKLDGSLWCWGNNSIGNIGNGCDQGPACNPDGSDLAPTPVAAPAQVELLTNVVTASAGIGHTCAIRAATAGGNAGTLWCWGEDDVGQLGDGQTVPASVGPPNYLPYHPQINLPERIGTASNWVQVAVGSYHTCGLKADGSLWCWGRDREGELGTGTPKMCQQDPDCSAPGTIQHCDTTSNSCVIDAQLTPVQVVPPQGSSASVTWTAVAAHKYQTCGIAGGQLYCWGSNNYGEQGNCTTDGSIFNPTPIQEDGQATNWVQVSVGELHACGVKADHSVWCWGFGFYGELGDGAFYDECAPQQVSSVMGASGAAESWLQVAAGKYFSAAVSTDNSLWTWGHDSNYQLGLGTSGTDQETPQQTH